MEDADGRLSVSERSVPTIEQKNKEADGHDRRGMETTTEGLMQTLAKLYEKPSASNKVFLMK